jgi:hypothetical protein
MPVMKPKFIEALTVGINPGSSAVRGVSSVLRLRHCEPKRLEQI